MAKKAKVSIKLVTPQMAKKYLAMNTMNRNVNSSDVQRLAQSMINGNFVLTNIGIGIDTNGVLTDGQKRLMAIIKSNTPVWLQVTENLEPIARIVVDTNKVRSPSNALQMSGIGFGADERGKKIDNTKLLASVSAYIILHQTNRFNDISSIGRVLTNDEILAFTQKNEEELMSSAKIVLSFTGKQREVQASHLLFVYQMHKFYNPTRITEFLKIVTGKVIPENYETCPAVKLRNTLLENSTKRSGGRLKTKDLIGLTVDASNKFMEGIQLGGRSKKLAARPNSSSVVNVKLQGQLDENGNRFFESIVRDIPLKEEIKVRKNAKSVSE